MHARDPPTAEELAEIAIHGSCIRFGSSDDDVSEE